MFPYYLSIGMTPEQYWEQDCTLVRDYREAERLRMKRVNTETWMQGLYFYQALLDASPILRSFAKPGTKPRPYPKEPLDLIEPSAKEKRKIEEKKQREVEEARRKTVAFFEALEKRWKKSGSKNH